MRLADVCKIQMGYTARGRLESAEADGVRAIQLRDISADGRIDLASLSRFTFDTAPERYLARGGDVLFRSRGERNTATVIGDAWNGSAIAVLPLVLLRAKRDLIAPGYLAWVLNQSPAQRHFDKTARGTSLRMVPRSSLDELIIDLPSLEQQNLIVEIDTLADRERALSELAAQKRRTLMSLILVGQARKTCPMDGFERIEK